MILVAYGVAMGRSFAVILLLMGLVFSCSNSEETQTQANSNSGNLCHDSALVAGKSIIGDNDWSPVDTGNHSLAGNEFAVAKLAINGTGTCTGFLINTNMIMTNNHCVSKNGVPVIAYFQAQNGDISTSCNQLVITDAALDFTILRCSRDLSNEIAPVIFASQVLATQADIYVIQQNCDYLKDPYCQIERMIAYGRLSNERRTIIDHTADTLPGSSGSPIFEESSHKVVALHNSGNPTHYDPNGLNHGINIQKVIAKINSSRKNVPLYFEKSDEFDLPPSSEIDQSKKCSE